jgi:hypothetical protein
VALQGMKPHTWDHTTGVLKKMGNYFFCGKPRSHTTPNFATPNEWIAVAKILFMFSIESHADNCQDLGNSQLPIIGLSLMIN